MRNVRSSGKAFSTASLISRNDGKVVAERFLKRDPGLFSSQSRGSKPGDGRLKQRRGGGQQDRGGLRSAIAEGL